METALRELRDNAAGRLAIRRTSPPPYLLPHVTAYRKLYPHVTVQVRRSLSSRLPSQLVDGDIELGVISYDPHDPRLASTVIFRDHLAFIVSPRHRLAARRSVSIRELGMENFIAHNVISPYRALVLEAFQRHKVPLHMDVEMPTIETIRKLVQAGEGVAFLPRMCVDAEIERRALCEVPVRELKLTRQVRVVYPARRALSRLARVPRSSRRSMYSSTMPDILEQLQGAPSNCARCAQRRSGARAPRSTSVPRGRPDPAGGWRTERGLVPGRARTVHEPPGAVEILGQWADPRPRRAGRLGGVYTRQMPLQTRGVPQGGRKLLGRWPTGWRVMDRRRARLPPRRPAATT